MRFFRLATLTVFLVALAHGAMAQVFSPVKYKIYATHVSGNTYDIYFKFKIKSGWFVYSQKIEGDDGPVPTTFEFNNAAGVKRVGSVSESGNKKTVYDDVFGMTLSKFSKNAIFKQRIKVDNPSQSYTITGGFEYMTCNNERCLPPTYNEFKVSTTPVKASAPVVSNQPKTSAPKPTVGRVEAVPSDDASWSAAGLPVQWKVEGLRVSKTEYDVTFTARVKEGWELYSAYTGSKGPMPLTIEYDNRDERLDVNKRLKREGGNLIKNYDDIHKTKLTRYTGEVSFTQRIKIEKGSRNLNGNLYYVASNPQQNTSTTPQRMNFSIKLPSKITPTEAMIAKRERERARAAAENTSGEAVADAGDDDFEDDDDWGEFEDEDAEQPVNDVDALNSVTATKFKYTYAKESCSGDQALNTCETSNWWIFLLGFGGGLLALLTPCIFPMIPITVSYFTKQSNTRAKGIANALAYGLSIIAIYVTLGMVITSIFGPEALNNMSTNYIVNIAFFLIFLFFAFSFFGFYELTLPSSWTTWTDNEADKRGGLLGIFFMAFTLALVSFSCTGPIIGTLLAETASQTDCSAAIFGRIPVKPLLGMLGFATALALPFSLFALFPSWLNSLPKSGGWMNTVKAVLGFIELGLALKFLSTADMVNHWGILPIEVFLGIWILVSLGLATYMFGLFKLPIDYGMKPKVTPARATIGVLALAFAAYMIYGLFTYKPLALLSGIAPSVTYNIFRNDADLEYPDCPQGIRCFKDYDEGLEFAKDRNMPVMIDFTGHACVNCRKMEENVWGKKEIKPLLSEKYVLISLYVDDRKKLEGDEANKYRNVGEKWAKFQVEHFGSNSQPKYVLMSPDEEILNVPVGYTPNVEEYRDFLQCGLDRWESIK